MNHPNPAILFRQLVTELPGTVRRTVVHQDHLCVLYRLRQQAFHTAFQRILTFIHRYNDTYHFSPSSYWSLMLYQFTAHLFQHHLPLTFPQHHKKVHKQRQDSGHDAYAKQLEPAVDVDK